MVLGGSSALQLRLLLGGSRWFSGTGWRWVSLEILANPYFSVYKKKGFLLVCLGTSRYGHWPVLVRAIARLNTGNSPSEYGQ